MDSSFQEWHSRLQIFAESTRAKQMDLETGLMVGMRVPVQKTIDGHTSYIKGEILAIRNKDTTKMYYIHFIDFNKRLDEWVDVSRMDLGNVEHPNKTSKKRPSLGNKEIATLTQQKSPRLDEKEEHLEALRRGGSMSMKTEEQARVKNVSWIEMGMHRINAWYFSPYPEYLVQDSVLYICETCLEPQEDETSLRRHRLKCTTLVPPGNEIYRKDNLSLFEIDGHKQKVWCRNLCLLSKLFLDHKTLYYDVDPFLFYVLTVWDDHGAHIVGYFSKEKVSNENYNVACILTLPQHQKKGYGKLLIGLSYELSKIQGVAGSPEKPLSDLGLLSYRSYWTEEMVKILVSAREISITDLSLRTSITCEDILHTLHAMDMLRYHRGQHIIVLPKKILADHERNMKKNYPQIDPQRIQWTVPTFLPNELRYV